MLDDFSDRKILTALQNKEKISVYYETKNHYKVITNNTQDYKLVYQNLQVLKKTIYSYSPRGHINSNKIVAVRIPQNIEVQEIVDDLLLCFSRVEKVIQMTKVGIRHKLPVHIIVFWKRTRHANYKENDTCRSVCGKMR